MRKRIFKIAKGVSNIELFYDLIFVYCINVITSLCHHVEGGFLQLDTWIYYLFTLLVVLQVWFFTTFLMNRYGDQAAADNICLFINMFLLYFLAGGIRNDWQGSIFTFNISWALILANLILHWCLKLWRYGNLDDVDRRIMGGTITVLAIELVLVVVAAFLPTQACAILSWVALLFGAGVFTLSRSYRRKPSRFEHLSERCALLVIIAFGEMLVAISANVGDLDKLPFAVFEFALVVGLFLIYIYEHDNMTDHGADTDGMLYLTLTGWVIILIDNLTVALEFMPDAHVALVPKSIFLTVCLVLYLLTSFALGRFNKPEFQHSRAYVAGRIAICVVLVAVALLTNYHVFANLVCQTVAVYTALLHEWLLFRRRTKLGTFCGCLSLEKGEEEEAQPLGDPSPPEGTDGQRSD